jgi:hypothetical protein
MYLSVDTRYPAKVELEVQSMYGEMFPEQDRFLATRAITWVAQCFEGKFRNYQAIDAQYHDLEHTLQGTLCLARILYGRFRAGAEPACTLRMFELGLLAILLHDTGFLKTTDDRQGTGAKYLRAHTARSSAFAAQFLTDQGDLEGDIETVSIHCTGVSSNISAIPFANELERTVGLALGAADLLGQMAADDYVDKLPILYAEFAEAENYDQQAKALVGSFTSAEDLMRKTPAFWENIVKPKLEKDFNGLYRFLNDPYPDGPNLYLQRVEGNLTRLKQKLGMT